MDFIENMEYKFIEVLSLEFKAADETTNKQSVSYRFGIMKNRLNLVQSRLSDISTMIKLKNPSLLQSIQKVTVPTSNSAHSNTKKLLGSTNYNSTGKIYKNWFPSYWIILIFKYNARWLPCPSTKLMTKICLFLICLTRNTLNKSSRKSTLRILMGKHFI